MDRVEKFVFQRDAKFALAGQLLSRYVLAQACRRSSASFDIRRTERGRPFVECTPAFDFNLSHHHHLVCIAGTFLGRVGCDTMEYQVAETAAKEPIESLTNLLRGEFTSAEYDFILKRTSDERTRVRHFYRLWCLKESYVKWLGDGLHFPLSKMNFAIGTEEFNEHDVEQVISDTRLDVEGRSPDEQLRFDEQVIQLANSEQQIVTLCLSIQHASQTFTELTIEQLLRGCTPLQDSRTDDDDSGWTSFQMKKVK